MTSSLLESNEIVLCHGVTLDNRGKIINFKKYVSYSKKIKFPYLDNLIENESLFPFEYYQSSNNSYKIDFHVSPNKSTRNHIVEVGRHLFPHENNAIVNWDGLMESLMIPLVTVGAAYSGKELTRMSLYYFSPNERGKKSEQVSLSINSKMAIIHHLNIFDEPLIQFVLCSDLKIVAIDIDCNTVSHKFYCSWSKNDLYHYLKKYSPDSLRTLYNNHFFEKNILLVSIANSALGEKKLSYYYD